MARFIYHNANPDKKTISDCVLRAISLGTGLSYPTVRRKLYHSAKLFECERLNIDCYRNLLEKVFEFPQVPTMGMSVGEFADTHPCGIYLVRMPQHISTIWNGDSVDIFDCRDYKITNAWKII
jgi:hypothetical protein